MQVFRTRFLLLSSALCLLLAGCSSAYRHLRPAQGDAACLTKFRPDFSKAVYKTQVDVVGKHLSGLLIIKRMPDSTTRMVFSNEFGFKFFDFEFSQSGDFKVHFILKEMNKKAVVKTLRKDFEILLMFDLDRSKPVVLTDGRFVYYKFKQSKGSNYYISDSACSVLVRAERASARKPVMQAIMRNYEKRLPDTIGITHTNFNFTIGLKKIQQ